MALGDSYPVELLDDQGSPVATEVAAVQFTDGNDQPSRSGGGSLPEGWVADDPNPGDLAAPPDAQLNMGDTDALSLSAQDSSIRGQTGDGNSAFSFQWGATVAETTMGFFGATAVSKPGQPVSVQEFYDRIASLGLITSGGALLLFPPTEDPAIEGALWNDGGTPAISTG